MGPGIVTSAIQLSLATYELIKGQFICEARGVIPVKGNGEMPTYLVVSRAPAPAGVDPSSVTGEV